MGGLGGGVAIVAGSAWGLGGVRAAGDLVVRREKSRFLQFLSQTDSIKRCIPARRRLKGYG